MNSAQDEIRTMEVRLRLSCRDDGTAVTTFDDAVALMRRQAADLAEALALLRRTATKGFDTCDITRICDWSMRRDALLARHKEQP